MKRCPECRRDYYDDTLLYCLDDGNALLEGPGGIRAADAPSYGYEPATVMIHSTEPTDATPTQVFAANVSHVDITNAIAVLPFANMSPNEDAEYLSDGLAEELLNVLSRIQGLRVAGRTSAFSFKGKQTTFAEIGRQLNVSSVLEGSVRMAGKRVRIAVQLVNVADGFHLWSETYDRTMDDIFAIQDDIAGSVVEELRSRLIGQDPDPDLSTQVAAEVAGAAKGRAEDPEAHRLMLLGRHLTDRRTADDLAKAVGYFEQALGINPQNAQCWIEIGNAQYSRAGHGFIGYEEGFEAVRAAAETALCLEPDLAGAHALLAKVKITHDLDFRGADESIRRALKLEPENVFVLQSAGSVIRNFGRSEEALEIGRKLLAIDPLNGATLQQVSQSAYLLGMLDEAETAARRALEITPKGVYKHAVLALILSERGCTDEARTEAASETNDVWGPWATALVDIAAGNISEANTALDALIEQYPEEAAMQIAEVFAEMGQIDKAFEYLDVAIETDPGISGVLVSRQLRPLHSDPRWQPLLRKIGIPKEYWPKI